MIRPGVSRRRFLTATAALPLISRQAAAAAPVAAFPSGFRWGVSTSAAQIEGAANEDGRGRSIWDDFADQPGRIVDASTPAVACDHYHRWREDVALMRDLGVGSYRFSIAWPRVLPQGRGAANAPGWAFYERLVDALLAAGIRPMPCLYHWDLPAALQAAGGWLNRDIAGWFADYARAAARRLGDRVTHWFMLNEPSVVALFGHAKAEHAPGVGGGAPAFFRSMLHQNLAQGGALAAMRAERKSLQLGTVLSLQPVVADSARPEDRAAAMRWDAAWNRLALDPLLRGAIPDALSADMAPLLKPGDLATMRAPIDMLGVNYYSKMTVKAETGGFLDVGWGQPSAARFTAMNWPVQPEGLFEILLELKTLYGNPRVIVTENGAAYDDVLAADRVADGERIAYLRDHLLQVHRALGQGCRVDGYMVWSLLDNFEWQQGFTRRFGLVYLDFPTLRRMPKQSFDWYRRVVTTRQLV